MVADAKSADDLTATSSLENTPNISYLLSNTNLDGGATYLDNGGSVNNRTFSISTVNARALGYTTYGVGDGLYGSKSDATISFSSAFTWDFDPSDGITPGSIDFVGVAMHEIGHAMGFSTEVDIIEKNPGLSPDSYTMLTILDLFRYSNSAEFGIKRDISDESTRTKYFSIDGGATAIGDFSNGVTYGKDYQASHWKDQYPNPPLGIMNPYITPSVQGFVSENDLMAMDVIGFDRNFSWNWSGGATGNWSKAWNWNTYVVPDNNKITAVFNGDGVNPTITLDSNPSLAALSVGSDMVVLEIEGSSFMAREIRVGDIAGKTGGLNVNGMGSILADNIYIGGTSTAAAGTGSMTIGANAMVISSNQVRIYASPSNRLKINAGGTLVTKDVHTRANSTPRPVTSAFQVRSITPEPQPWAEPRPGCPALR